MPQVFRLNLIAGNSEAYSSSFASRGCSNSPGGGEGVNSPGGGQGVPNPYTHVQGLRALVLQWMNRVDEDITRKIHDLNQPKPFTVSPLWISEETDQPYFEITAMVDWVAEMIAEGIAGCDGQIRLGRDSFQLTDAALIEQVSWNELYQTPRPHRACWTFHLLSPTAHHVANNKSTDSSGVGGGDFRKAIVLPSPEYYYGSWINRWGITSEYPLNDNLRELIVERMVVSECQGHTLRVEIEKAPHPASLRGNEKEYPNRRGRGRTMIGFIGEVTFELLQPHTAPPGAIEAITALSRFARYSGTGVETMRGMGQTRYVS